LLGGKCILKTGKVSRLNGITRPAAILSKIQPGYPASDHPSHQGDCYTAWVGNSIRNRTFWT